jgi:hypothetical protein
MTTKENKETKKPIVNANSYGVSVAIWENTNKAGKQYQSLSINASTKQEDGTYKNRTIFFPSDLENMIAALTELKKEAEITKQQIKLASKEQTNDEGISTSMVIEKKAHNLKDPDRLRDIIMSGTKLGKEYENYKDYVPSTKE